MVLSGWVGTPELHAAYGRVADIVKKAVAGTTLTANLTGPAATGDDMMFIGIKDMHAIEGAVVLMVLIILFVIYRNLVTMMLPLITIGVSVGVAQSVVAGVAELGLGVSSQTITLDDDDDGGRRRRLRRVSHQPLPRLCAAGHAFRPSRRQGVDLDRQSDRRVRGHGVDHLSGHGLHPFGLLQERRSVPGDFDCVGVSGCRDFPSGTDGPRRTAQLDQATSRPDHPFLAATGNTHRASTRESSGRQPRSCWPFWPAARSLPTSTTTTARRSRNRWKAPSDIATLAHHFPLNATIPEYLVVQSEHDLRKPANLSALNQLEQRVRQMPDIAAIHGAPVPKPKSTDKSDSEVNDSWTDSALDGKKKDKSNDDGAGSFPNVTNLLYSVGATGQRCRRPRPARHPGHGTGRRRSMTPPTSSTRCVASASPCPWTSQKSPTRSTAHR